METGSIVPSDLFSPPPSRVSGWLMLRSLGGLVLAGWSLSQACWADLLPRQGQCQGGGRSSETSLLGRRVLPCVHTSTQPFLKHPRGSFPLDQVLPSGSFSSRPAHMLPVLTLTRQPAWSYYLTLLQNLLSGCSAYESYAATCCHLLSPGVGHYPEAPRGPGHGHVLLSRD